MKFPEALDYLCTCGTIDPIPGEGYGCLFQTKEIGYPPETLHSSYIDGYNCLNLTGCNCGKSKCFPDLCISEYNANGCCDSEYTLKCTNNKYTCGNHRLPCETVVHGYACLKDDSENSSKKPSPKSGWYCNQSNGCPCGKNTCEQYQKCEAPGVCSKQKLTDTERSKLMYSSIKRAEGDNYECEAF